MGYESKIIVGHRVECNKFNWMDIFAQFDLCKMGYEMVDGRSFRGIFREEIDFPLFIQNGDGQTEYPEAYWREDRYGEICHYTDIQSVIDWLEASEIAKEWSRAALALECLKALAAKDPNFIVVHYGY